MVLSQGQFDPSKLVTMSGDFLIKLWVAGIVTDVLWVGATKHPINYRPLPQTQHYLAPDISIIIVANAGLGNVLIIENNGCFCENEQK